MNFFAKRNPLNHSEGEIRIDDAPPPLKTRHDFDFLLDLVGVRRKKTVVALPDGDQRNRCDFNGGVVSLTVNHGEAIWLTIPATGGTKCVSEEIQSHVVVMADYYVVDEQNPGNTPAVSAKQIFNRH
ncbi:hypothetical protein Bca52824_011883 [Brassica carinata]|uniref:Uncharacterized protein n=1 Tax=Brassica carinata TaxID=52824 RepID=A0A8X8B0Z5_BRACI|nr:hypothetical protein Bca52824_011883 [Brassica carinata]